MPLSSSRVAPWALALLTLLLAFAGSDAMSLKGCDEAFYAQIAKEMVQTGDWITPHYAGGPNFEKPPLLFWLVAASFSLFGVGDFQARLPVLLAGMLVVLASAGIAWLVRRDVRTALVAGAVTATTGLFLQVWHQVMLDVPALVPLAGMVLGLLGQTRDRRFGWLVGPSLGALILAKGALAGLIAFACLPYLLWRRRWPDRSLLLGLVVGLLPAIAWYGAMHGMHGADFWRIHLGQQVLERAQSGLFAKDPLGPAFYLVHMLGTFLPWSLVIPAAVLAGFRRARAGDGAAFLATSFLTVFLVVISLMQTKFEHYALPLLLPVALLVADWVKEPPRAGDRWIGGSYLGLSLLVVAAVVAIPLMRLPLEVPQPAWTLVAVGALGLSFAWGGWACWRRMDRARVAFRLAAGVGLSFVAAAQLLHLWDAVPAVRQAAAQVPAAAEAHLVLPGGLGRDFCTYSALRFRLPGALDVVEPAQFPHGPRGWYVGKAEHLAARPGDRLVAEVGGWRLVERP